MTKPYIEFLAGQAGADRVAVTPELDAALAELDAELERLAPAVEVEVYGPGVGVEGEQDVYKLVVRPHEWQIGERTWSLKVCDALPNCEWRATWPVQGVGRLRKQAVVRALPEFFRQYAEAVEAAGRADDEAGREVMAMAAAFRG